MLNKKIIRVLIISVLLLFGISLMGLRYFVNESSISVLSESFVQNGLANQIPGQILIGNKLTGKFRASYDYLGIVSIRFLTFSRMNDDFLKFSIKEVGADKWYYRNLYKTDQFQPDQLFPFGFPAIPDSGGKVYEYEIESTAGIPGDAVGVSTINPVLIVKYQYPRELIASGISSLIRFSGLKIGNILKSSNLNLIFALPLIIYLIKIVPVYKYKFGKRNLSLILIFLGLFIDFNYKYINILTFVVLLGVLIWVMVLYKIPHRLYLFIAIIMLMLSISFPEKTIVWVEVLLALWITSRIWFSTL